MLSKRVRLALSAGVLGLALTATLTAAANADGAQSGARVVPACESAAVKVTEKDGKLIATVNGKEHEVARAAEVKPADSVPAVAAESGASGSGTDSGSAQAVAASELTPAATVPCGSEAAAE
ncbi:hypothetical protein FHR32_008549 [Streptosporangium album]|uniref:Uncharacterized protein n=1 Tax=Streptosporangium album TaxID=47479 RepID=A0A7W7WEH9_9ACTN|nr:hypothetical protein [Streptosporangium album]MBB4944146.1 hypothetical protein [Streptosporangium album]